MKKTNRMRSGKIGSVTTTRHAEPVQVISAAWQLSSEEAATLAAFSGHGAYPRRQLASDTALMANVSDNLNIAVEKAAEGAPLSRTWIRVEMFDDVGLADIASPIVCAKAMIERATNAIKVSKLEASVFAHHRPLMDHPDQPGGAMLTFCRALAYTDEALDLVALEKRMAREFRGKSLPRLKVSVVKPAKLGRTVGWLAGLRYETLNWVRDPDGNVRVVNAVQPADPEMELRLLECLSQRELSAVMIGVGKGKKLCSAVRTKVTSYHRGRLEHPDIIEALFDVFAFWCALRREHGNPTYNPYRFDTATKPLTPPPPRKRKGKGPMRPKGVGVRKHKKRPKLKKPAAQ